ncbi:MAG: RNA 2',3'-cyclic phosphodiesterase [Firmicutes bacterium]|nr:RNA 2',3'-cyclic phosphodiesterase [Bacillota bacterium]
MRAFLAVNLDEKMREKVAEVQEKLKKRTSGIRWVKPELLHLTLKFLGDIRAEELKAFEQHLEKAAREVAAFHLTFNRLGAFPGLRNPRVIWIGTQTGTAQLVLLASKIENIFKSTANFQSASNKVKDTTPFVPHLTIGRRQKNSDLLFPMEIFRESFDCKYALHVDRFFLMQSTLYSSGPVYTPVKEFLLDSF